MQTRLFSLCVGLSLISASAAYSFQIDSVAVSPLDPGPLTPYSLIVSMTAPSAPGYLFAPTQINFDGYEISIDMFVGSGPLTVIMPFDEEVNLGRLSGGTYHYTVELTTEFPVGWGLDRRVATGTFSVIGPRLAGDYNNNGIVDSADFTVWRNTVGTAPGTLPNDVNGGIIDERQYNTWRANFGDTLGSLTGLASALVPEPSSAVMIALAVLVLQPIRWFRAAN